MRVTNRNTRVKCVEKSYEMRPLFLLEIEGVEYISSGRLFVENTPGNIEKLVKKHGFRKYLDELFAQPWIGLDEVTNAVAMFRDCTSLVSFDADMPALRRAPGMFAYCINLASPSAGMSALKLANEVQFLNIHLALVISSRLIHG